MIIVIIAAIIIVEFYKRERNRITANLHSDNLKNLLTITAIEYQHIHSVDIVNDSESELIEKRISLLVSSYEKGEMQEAVFQKKMYTLLKS
jgi:hypothetical protein